MYEPHFYLGQIFDQEGDIDSAIAEYKKAVLLNPVYYYSHYALGTLLAKKLDGPQALWHLRESVRLKPDFAEGYNNLAALYASMLPPQLKLAVEFVRKAVDYGYAVDKELLEKIGIKP